MNGAFMKTVKVSGLRIKGTIMQIEKALNNDRLRVSEIVKKFRIPIICDFVVIYP